MSRGGEAADLKGILGSLRRIFWRGDGSRAKKVEETPAEITRRLVDIIARTQPEECTCEEAYALMDQFAEALERGDDVNRLMPLVRRHLEVCTDCMEEFEALLRVVQAPPAGTASA